MIDLSKTYQDMLRAIGASEDSAATTPLAVTDPRCLTEEQASFRLIGCSRDDLFPLLEVVLTQRFFQVPRLTLMGDLLGPLKNGLGNAYKHGNRRDDGKRIVVDGHFAPGGVCISITDEGPGFDVQATLDRFHEDDHYFDNYGVGFQNFSRSASLLSYANGGRTLLLCFELEKSGSIEPPPLGSMKPESPFEKLPENLPETLRPILQEDRDMPLEPHERIALYGPRPGEPGSSRCVLTSTGGRFVAIYALQRFSSVEAARADYTATRVLHASITRQKVRMPRPVALLEDPPLVVYDFAPSMNLWTYLLDRGNTAVIEKISRRLGIVLAKYHGAPLQVPEETRIDTLRRWVRALENTHASLLSLEPSIAPPLRSIRETLLQRADLARQEHGTAGTTEDQEESFETVVHGNLGWDCIHYGVNGRFYLSRFLHSRRGHPALDLGGFLADLLAHCDSTGQAITYSIGEKALLEGYDHERRFTWTKELPLFVAGTLVERMAALASWKSSCANPKERPDWIAHLDVTRLAALCSRSLEPLR